MPLSSGTRLGHYDITSPLGAGGMGEVYRAKDTRLGRDVALKTLPESFTRDPERLARFKREAQILASLNHPHIASIYGIEEIDGRHLLILELVDGESLATLLRRGPLPVDESLTIGREIVLALEAAHERGIVHRDLKPGNVALAADGTVKVLDFGLARNADPSPASHAGDLANSPTITSPMTLTALGVILGTAAYMSPEQARGAVADKRSDVWAFGCVLFEMLTGARAFSGDDVTDTLASVVRSQPDWTLLPASVPPAVRALLEGCLEKDRRRRIGDIAAARFVLERGGAMSASAPEKAMRRSPWPWLAAAALVAALAIGVAAYLTTRSSVAPVITRYVLQLPQGQDPGYPRRALAVSPDGTRIIYGANGRLLMQSVSDFEAQPIAGTESGALQPTFSPDGQSLAFWSDGVVRRVALSGGVPVPLCNLSPAPFGLKWTERGILMAVPGTGIVVVPPAGGSPATLVTATDEFIQGVELLPDGETLLFTTTQVSGQSNIWELGQIVRHSLPAGERKTLIPGGSNPVYVPSGHLLYTVEGTLMAVPFDASRGEVSGSAVPVVEGILRVPAGGGAETQAAVSRNGTLIYIPGPARSGNESVFIYARDGAVQQLNLPRGTYAYPRVSPGGKWVSMESYDGKLWAVAVYNLTSATALRRLTFEGNNRYPVWTGGNHLVFQSDREGDLGLFRQSLTGGPAERLTRAEPGTAHVPESWSGVHDTLLYSVSKGTSHTLWMLSMTDRKSATFGDVTSVLFPTNSVFSPDGRWVAYQVGDGSTGETRAYVQPFPATGTKYELGRGGRLLWSLPDGKQLFFIPGPQQFAVTNISTASGTFDFTAPESVPRRFGLAPPANPRPYDFLPDGRTVGINTAQTAESPGATQIRVVQNWFEELKTKVPVR